MFHDNVVMNENVLHSADKHGASRGVFCASTCVYPAQPPAFPVREYYSLSLGPTAYGL
jgi:nucleoside-diphosphate-sugar epimerase